MIDITCPKCDAPWTEETLNGTGVIYLGWSECSYLELCCHRPECQGKRRRFCPPDAIEAVAEHFSVTLSYEANPSFEVMGAFYHLARLNDIVKFSSAGDLPD